MEIKIENINNLNKSLAIYDKEKYDELNKIPIALYY